MKKQTLIGPFRQVLTMENLPLGGRLKDEQLVVLKNAGLLIQDGLIVRIVPEDEMLSLRYASGLDINWLEEELVLMPGLVDCHTHICFAGSRSSDFSARLSGKNYPEIAADGGGIQSTVQQTGAVREEELLSLTRNRALQCLRGGVTTLEIKSGYGLTVASELRMLRILAAMRDTLPLSIVPTCLAAHSVPREFKGNSPAYLQMLIKELLPVVKSEKLSNRVDVFVEKSAFSCEEAEKYLLAAKELGFDTVVHADQFTPGGSMLAVRTQALSADHLEASGEAEIQMLAGSSTVAVCLPGASLGLGEPFAPARALLDAGACVAIASDWNPGSAPMGDLLLQASVLAVFEKLSNAEVFAGLTFRAAQALNLQDRGRIQPGMRADFIAFPTADYREILYLQGRMKPARVWADGILLQKETTTTI